MEMLDLQAKIDQIHWYHEFDFGGGLKARSIEPDVEPHRRIWRFIEQQIDMIDFRGKTVLDIGCWDGYWSFLAEKKGAKSVLASDDLSQNWSEGKGLLLAKQLLQSTIDIKQDLSIYQLASLKRTFDIIMCLGVYYHLLDPLYAFAQIRHCCHSDSIVLLEGDVGINLKPGEVLYSIAKPRPQAFLPSLPALEGFLKAAFLRLRSQARLTPPLRAIATRLKGVAGRRVALDRVFLVCVPFEGVNELHYYEPPFGLKVYDDRFRGLTCAKVVALDQLFCGRDAGHSLSPPALDKQAGLPGSSFSGV